jgi:hypothetical protein
VFHRWSQALGGHEDVDDAAISQKRHGPKKKKDDSEQIRDQGMLRGKISPVGMDNALEIFGKVVQMRSP